jgi:flagella basal body P-ring formation protein FlgA
MIISQLAFLLLSAAGVCLPVTSDRILSSELARVLPEFAILPGEKLLSYSPVPGQRRIFSVEELRRLAKANQIEAFAREPVCFEWPLRTPSTDEIVTAMREALPGANSEIEVVEADPQPVPPGKLEFPLSNLSAPAANSSFAPVLWRGLVRYSTNRYWTTWARVHVVVSGSRLISVPALDGGQILKIEQVRLEEYRGFPKRGVDGLNTADVVGRRVRRSIPAGTVLSKDLFEVPREVDRGDTVHVEVRAGTTRLILEGKAETAGGRGDWVSVRNPVSGKTFRARVENKDWVLVQDGN